MIIDWDWSIRDVIFENFITPVSIVGNLGVLIGAWLVYSSWRTQSKNDCNVPSLLDSIPLPPTRWQSTLVQLHDRVTEAKKSAEVAVWIMWIVVLFGAGATIGLWAYSRGQQLTLLEAERKEAREASEALKTALEAVKSGKHPGIAGDATKYIEGAASVKERFGRIDKFEDLVSEVRESAKSNWGDLAIRVTIAALTVFLLQIVFAVYKYNRRLSIALQDRLQVLALLSEDDETVKILRTELIRLLKGGSPSFSEAPTHPMEDALTTLERLLAVQNKVKNAKKDAD